MHGTASRGPSVRAKLARAAVAQRRSRHPVRFRENVAERHADEHPSLERRFATDDGLVFRAERRQDEELLLVRRTIGNGARIAHANARLD